MASAPPSLWPSQREIVGMSPLAVSMQPVADKNPALNYFTDDKRSFLACDASTFQLREFHENIINPFSNRQGPVWPIANCLYSIALKNYGFDHENEWLAATVGSMLLADVRRCGTMHEDYNADTAAPLTPSDDHTNPDGSIVGFMSWNLCIHNLLEGVTEQEWMLLDL
jgi:hypothetical protein